MQVKEALFGFNKGKEIGETVGGTPKISFPFKLQFKATAYNVFCNTSYEEQSGLSVG